MENIAMGSLRSQNYNFKARDEKDEWRNYKLRLLRNKLQLQMFLKFKFVPETSSEIKDHFTHASFEFPWTDIVRHKTEAKFSSSSTVVLLRNAGSILFHRLEKV